MKNRFMLRVLLLAGALYFLAIALVHLFGIKIPGLYIYYDVPSHRYQDQIISFLMFGWAWFFFIASRHVTWAKYLLVPLLVALVGLANVNLSNDFAAMGEGVTTTPYWIEFGLLTIYAAVLTLFILKNGDAN